MSTGLPAGNISKHQADLIRKIINNFDSSEVKQKLRELTNKTRNPTTLDYFDVYIELANKRHMQFTSCKSKTKINGLNPQDLQGTTANCKYAVISSFFYKFQISKQADPLENDVLVNCILKAKVANSDQFLSLLEDYFILDQDTTTIWPSNNMVPVIKSPELKFELLGDFITRNQHLDFSEAHGLDFLSRVTQSLKQFVSIQATIPGFAHNDLHLNNIMIEKNSNTIRIFDFGRAYIPETEVPEGLVNEIIAKLCLDPKADLKEMIYRNHKGLEFHQNRHAYAFYCEIATVIFSIVQSVPGLIYPSFFTVNGDMVEIGSVDDINFYLNNRQLCKNELFGALGPHNSPKYQDAYIFCFDALVCLAAVVRAWFYNIPNSSKISINIDSICDFKGYNNLIMQNGLVHPAAFKMNAFTTQLDYLVKSLNNKDVILTGGNSNSKKILSEVKSAVNQNRKFVFDTAYLDKATFLENWEGIATQLAEIVEPSNQAEPMQVLHSQRKSVQASAGGSRGKTYRIHVDKENNKKYIRRGRKRVYLEAIRGRYRYATDSRDSVTLK